MTVQSLWASSVTHVAVCVHPSVAYSRTDKRTCD